MNETIKVISKHNTTEAFWLETVICHMDLSELILAIAVLALTFSWAWIITEIKDWCRNRSSPATIQAPALVPPTTRPTTRSVLVQSQVKYTWKAATPRFTPLTTQQLDHFAFRELRPEQVLSDPYYNFGFTISN